MIAKWFAELWAKAGMWLALAGAVLAAVAAAAVWGERKGKQVGIADAAQDAIREANAAAKQVKDAAQTRAGVEAEASQLPDAPAQKVADADPATAAGKLRDDGWTRD